MLSPSTPNPSVRLRRLSRELRAIREAAPLSLEEAATRLGWSSSTLSRLETGRVRATPAKVGAILALYDVDESRKASLLQLARDAHKRGWWTNYDGVLTGSYVGLEDEAEIIRSWQGHLIPGLLQTADYAREVMRAGRPDEDPKATELRVVARMARQSLLNRRDGPCLHAVVCESALRRPIGGADVMRAQLETLESMSWKLTVKLQVVPLAIGTHAGLEGSFIVLSFPEPDSDVAFVETVAGDLYEENLEIVARIRERFDRIALAALSVSDSRDLVSEIARGISR
ncbi:helix-turn-helix transcriptional regulator [Sphaerisporangium sp. NPDC051011]|uniref:helix-turn-helix domain-containing protein n=1 Tax=Sphaerisporangium sp. NPDC051011 TaxID=3155792 RepID=UPI0033D389E2